MLLKEWPVLAALIVPVTAVITNLAAKVDNKSCLVAKDEAFPKVVFVVLTVTIWSITRN